MLLLTHNRQSGKQIGQISCHAHEQSSHALRFVSCDACLVGAALLNLSHDILPFCVLIPCSCVAMLSDLYHAENACGAATVGSSEVSCHLVTSCQEVERTHAFSLARRSFKKGARLTDGQESLLCGLQLMPCSAIHALWGGL